MKMLESCLGAVQEDMKDLLRDAAEGLPVAKRKLSWETDRPTVKAVGDATKMRGFVEYGRQPLPYRPVEDRLQDYGEVLGRLPQQDEEELLHTQAARCMDCSTPFCHQTSSGKTLSLFCLCLHFALGRLDYSSLVVTLALCVRSNTLQKREPCHQMNTGKPFVTVLL